MAARSNTSAGIVDDGSEQDDAVTRARNTPVVASRTRRRDTAEQGWTFKPAIRLRPDQDVDIRKLLGRTECSDATSLMSP